MEYRVPNQVAVELTARLFMLQEMLARLWALSYAEAGFSDDDVESLHEAIRTHLPINVAGQTNDPMLAGLLSGETRTKLDEFLATVERFRAKNI